MGICASGEKEELGDSVLVLHPCPLPLSLLAWHCSSDFNEGTGENALMVPIFQMLRAAALRRPPLPRGIFWAMRLQKGVPRAVGVRPRQAYGLDRCPSPGNNLS